MFLCFNGLSAEENIKLTISVACGFSIQRVAVLAEMFSMHRVLVSMTEEINKSRLCETEKYREKRNGYTFSCGALVSLGNSSNPNLVPVTVGFVSSVSTWF